jgi:segregation and condensation protein B
MQESIQRSAPPLKQIFEAALLASGEAMDHAQLAALFEEGQQPSPAEISKALEELERDCEGRGVELRRVASGYRMQVRESLQEWISRLWTERPQRYSRALLETLALVAYRQPITRGEIENVRGVSLSSNIIRTLQERDWIRVVGHRDVPGKPALFGTSRAFLDHFNLNSLDQLPTLSEIRDLDNLEPEFDFEAADDEADLDEAESEREADESTVEPGG